MTIWTRRTFLDRSSKALAGAAGLAAGLGTGRAETISEQGQLARKPAASDKVRVALIGCGGRGTFDLDTFLRLREVDCAAVIDVDDHRAAETAQNVEKERGRKPATGRDFRRVLERRDIDAVIIAAPDHWHALQTILACQAGKDVYVEKPLATSIAEGRAMVQAARRYNRVVQVGTQQRSAEHFQEAVAFVRSGALGRLRFVRGWAYLDWKGSIGAPADRPAPDYVDYDLWLGPAPRRPFNPMRFHHNFRWFWDYSGGLMTDWGAHMVDVVRWALDGEPLSAASTGGKFGYPGDIRETPDTQQALIAFPEFTLLWECAIGCGIGPWQREHGVEFHGQNGILVVDRNGWEVLAETDAFAQSERVYRLTPKPRQPGSRDYDLEHVRDFVSCVLSRGTPVADVEVGHRSLIPTHLANISYRLGRSVRWDAAREEVVGDPEARPLVGRVYRSPWALPSA